MTYAFSIGARVKFSTIDHYNGLTGKILRYDHGQYRCSVDQDHKHKDVEISGRGIVFSERELSLRNKRKVV